MKMLRRGGWSREDAEDLVQDAFLRVEQYRQKVEVRSEEALLRRTVRNLSINQYHHNRLVDYADVAVEQLVDSLVTSDPCADPERRLYAQQRLEEIQRVLDAGSRQTREIYIAHHSGYTYREIAAAYGIGERTVEKHIARAIYLLMQAKERL
jgi:RNA polymerase sigma-70 factor (ECF subfamily)